MVIDNQDTDKIVMRLGTDTSATGFEVQNNSEAAKLSVNGAGLVTVGGDIQATSIINTTVADMVIDNQDTDKKIIMRLGTDTSATGFEVQNDSAAAKFAVNGAGLVTVGGDIQATSIINTTVADMVIDNQDTDKKIIMRLGTDTSATGFEVQNDSANAKFAVNGAGLVTVGGDIQATSIINTTVADMVIDNQDTDKIIMRLGTDTSATGFEVQIIVQLQNLLLTVPVLLL